VEVSKKSRVSNGEEDESAGTRNEVSDNNPCAPSTSETELKKVRTSLPALKTIYGSIN
jgi:hypothetical protein